MVVVFFSAPPMRRMSSANLRLEVRIGVVFGKSDSVALGSSFEVEVFALNVPCALMLIAGHCCAPLC